MYFDDMPRVTGVEHVYPAVGDIRVHCAIAGDGPPLVLLHGWPQHWWSWRSVIGPLAERFRVICPDIRGMGWTEGPSDDHHLRTLTRDLLGLLDVLGLERVRLAGHDWGFLIGYSACFTQPQRFERFVPMGGVTPWAGIGAPPSLYLRAWHIAVLASPIGPLLVDAVARNRLHAWRKSGRFSEEETRAYMTPLRPAATLARDKQLVRRDIPWFLRHAARLRLRVPTLHLNGALDPLTQGVPDSYRHYADDMRLELVPESGHFIAEEQPQALLDRLDSFL